eukprot:3640723-Rhodomonas_salina.1
MLKLRAALEAGGIVHVLNPGPIIEGVHALLNNAGAAVSTLQMGRAYEHVRVHSSTQIIVHVERKAALDLHKALLSRVSVVNSGFLRWTRPPGPQACNAHEALRRFYCHNALPESDLEEWMDKEQLLLEQSECTLEDLFEGQGRQDTTIVSSKQVNNLLIALVHGNIPRTLTQKDRIHHIEAVSKETPKAFLQAALDTLAKTKTKTGQIVLLDLTGATAVAAVEVMILLGLSAIKFDLPNLPSDFQEQFLHLCFKSNTKVILALDSTCAAAAVAPSNAKIKTLRLPFALEKH